MARNIFLYIIIFGFFCLLKIELKATDMDKVVLSKEVTLSPSNYTQETNIRGIVIVDFWAPWCGYCRKLDPILKCTARDTNIKIRKFNIDTYPSFVSQLYGVKTIPTLIIYKDGEEIHRLSGVFSKEELLLILKPYL